MSKNVERRGQKKKLQEEATRISTLVSLSYERL